MTVEEAVEIVRNEATAIRNQAAAHPDAQYRKLLTACASTLGRVANEIERRHVSSVGPSISLIDSSKGTLR